MSTPVFAKDPPFRPSAVVDEFSNHLRDYRVRFIHGDHYAGEFPKELFRRHSIIYKVSDHNKSALYQNLLPLLNSGRITFPRNDTLIKQLVGLQRRVGPSGRETIDHGQRKVDHNDIANAVAGAAELCSEAKIRRTNSRARTDCLCVIEIAAVDGEATFHHAHPGRFQPADFGQTRRYFFQ